MFAFLKKAFADQAARQANLSLQEYAAGLEVQLNIATDDITTLEMSNYALEEEIQDLEREVGNLEYRCEDLENEVQVAYDTVAYLEEDITTLMNENAELFVQLNGQRLDSFDIV